MAHQWVPQHSKYPPGGGGGSLATFETIWLILTQKLYPALEFSGKKYSQENGTSMGTPT